MITALIIDDDACARHLVREFIVNNFPVIDIILEAGSLSTGINEIRKHKPGLIFLDMELPDASGYELFEYTLNYKADIIVVTAHSKYVFNVVNHSPAGFLEKPFTLCQFNELVTRVLLRRSQTIACPGLCNGIHTPLVQNKLAVKDTQLTHLVPHMHIIRCESNRNYTQVIRDDGPSILITQTLKIIEKKLPFPHFIRVHQSHLVNFSFIDSVSRRDNTIYLSNNTKIPVSDSKREILNTLLNNL